MAVFLCYTLHGKLDQQPIQGEVDFDCYKRIYHFSFRALHDWADQIRSINISKKKTASVSAFKRLSTFGPAGLSRQQLAVDSTSWL
ncbi:MAG TPA: hypothetical protein H9764_02410 [Candidatus Flavonifractor merdavium]|nr:hypothetical protein [Candidatus Flavonifractor merdavium]